MTVLMDTEISGVGDLQQVGASVAAVLGFRVVRSWRGSGIRDPVFQVYRGTSLMGNNPSLGPYSRLIPRALWWS